MYICICMCVYIYVHKYIYIYIYMYVYIYILYVCVHIYTNMYSLIWARYLEPSLGQVIFEHEASLYRREGIRWDPLDFPDNHAIVDMIGGTAVPGICPKFYVGFIISPKTLCLGLWPFRGLFRYFAACNQCPLA